MSANSRILKPARVRPAATHRALVGAFVRELFRGVWGVLNAASLVGSIAALFVVPRIATARWGFFGLLMFSVFWSSFRLYRRLTEEHDRIVEQLAAQRDAEQSAIRQERDETTATLRAEIERLSRPPLARQAFQLAQRAYQGLNSAYKEAIRYLLIRGEMTDREMVAHIARIDYGRYATILDGVAEHTPFVRRLDRTPTKEERLLGGFEHRYMINPELRPAIERLVAEDTELQRTLTLLA